MKTLREITAKYCQENKKECAVLQYVQLFILLLETGSLGYQPNVEFGLVGCLASGGLIRPT